MANLFDLVAARYLPSGRWPRKRKRQRHSKLDRNILRRRRRALRIARQARRLERDREQAIPDARPTWDDLSPRTQEFAILLACGYKPRAIAHYMGGISPGTVNGYGYNLTRKLRMTRVTIAHWVRDQGKKIVEPLDYLDRVRYKKHPMANRSIPVDEHLNNRTISVLEALDELAELGPKLKERPRAAQAVANQIAGKLKQVTEHLTKGTAPAGQKVEIPEG